MKHLFNVFLALLLTALITACGKTEPTTPAAQPAFNPAIDLKIVAWGPQEAKPGEIPNKQPNGNTGIWIKVNTLEGLGEVQVLFGGEAVNTVVEAPQMVITAAIPPASFTTPGDKDVAIKQVGSQKIFPVGTFKTLK